MSDAADLVFFQDRPAVMVASYCRSGNHFLMNSLANCYGYVAAPWIDLDPMHHKPIYANGYERRDVVTIYYSPSNLADYLLQLARRPLATIIKAHLHPDFYAGAFERIISRYVIFVVHRHPADTLRSYWHFLGGMGWNEGPKPDNVIDFAKSPPMGAILRYQLRQYPTMMHHWADVAESWLAAATAWPRIVLVSYDRLRSNFQEVMKSLAPALGVEPLALKQPDRDVSPWIRSNLPRMRSEPDMDALRKLCRETIGETMDRLGYE